MPYITTFTFETPAVAQQFSDILFQINRPAPLSYDDHIAMMGVYRNMGYEWHQAHQLTVFGNYSHSGTVVFTNGSHTIAETALSQMGYAYDQIYAIILRGGEKCQSVQGASFELNLNAMDEEDYNDVVGSMSPPNRWAVIKAAKRILGKFCPTADFHKYGHFSITMVDEAGKRHWAVVGLTDRSVPHFSPVWGMRSADYPKITADVVVYW